MAEGGPLAFPHDGQDAASFARVQFDECLEPLFVQLIFDYRTETDDGLDGSALWESYSHYCSCHALVAKQHERTKGVEDPSILPHPVVLRVPRRGQSTPPSLVEDSLLGWDNKRNRGSIIMPLIFVQGADFGGASGGALPRMTEYALVKVCLDPERPTATFLHPVPGSDEQKEKIVEVLDDLFPLFLYNLGLEESESTALFSLADLFCATYRTSALAGLPETDEDLNNRTLFSVLIIDKYLHQL